MIECLSLEARPFQSSLLVGKAWSIPQSGSGLTHKLQIRLDRPARKKTLQIIGSIQKKSCEYGDSTLVSTLGSLSHIVNLLVQVPNHCYFKQQKLTAKVWSLLLVGNPRGLPQSGTPERCFTRIGTEPTHTHKARLKRPSRNNRSCVFGICVVNIVTVPQYKHQGAYIVVFLYQSRCPNSQLCSFFQNRNYVERCGDIYLR